MWEITKQNLGDKFGESLWLKVYCDTPMCFSVCVCVCFGLLSLAIFVVSPCGWSTRRIRSLSLCVDPSLNNFTLWALFFFYYFERKKTFGRVPVFFF